MERKVILNFPPASSVWHLPIGIAQLAAVLEKDGHEVEQSYGHIKGTEHLLAQHGGELANQALAIVRSARSSIHELYGARNALADISASIPTKDKFSVQRNNIIYVSENYNGTIEGVIAAVRDQTDHLFYEYFRDEEVANALRMRPDVYGISVADERQFIQACVLASMIKDALPETLVVMGGNFWSRILTAFKDPRFAKFFDFCDAIVYREGHQPLREIVSTLSPAKTPGTVWRDKETVIINPPANEPVSFQGLPTPIFAETRQWSPDRVYPLYTMSNCPMKCSFCAISAGSDTYLEKPRAMSPKRIAQHMVALACSRFDIQDETFSIPQQVALGDELKRIGHPATWNCYMTITNQLLDPEICKKLYEAGCRSVQLGLESLSTAVLKQESKHWNHPDNYARILKNLADAGIQNHVFIITGIPGEPLTSSLRWLPFIEENGDNILTIKSSRYRLTKGSPEEKFGSIRIGMPRGMHGGLIEPLPDDKPLHLNRDFKYKDTSRKRVETVRDLHEQMCREHWAYNVTSTLPWWINRGRHDLAALRQMAKELTSYTKEDEVPHLEKILGRTVGIVRDERKKEVKISTYSEAVEVARGL